MNDSKEDLRSALSTISVLSDEDWNYFSSKLNYIEISKNESVLDKGDIENNMSFLTHGAVRLFIPRLKHDMTFGFVFEHEFVSAYDSFLSRSPAHYSVYTLSDSGFWQISYDDLQEVYDKTSIGDLIGRRMAEKMFLVKARRELALLGKSAKQRYSDLFLERPRLIKEIPLQYVASYLGVTRESLSRIRKEHF